MTSDATLPTCAQHPDRETRLSCPRCGRPVCDVCMATTGGQPPCPACHEELGRQPVPPRRGRADAVRSAPVTFGLLAVLVVIFLATSADTALLEGGAQINALVLQGQWWRVLSAMLLHANLTHLLFNGYALYALGAQLERGVGGAAFSALFVASGLAGGIAFLLAAPGQVAVGASGAIFGLFGAWFAAAWVQRHTPQGRAGLSQFGVLLALNLALPLFIRDIAWQAHVGGLLVGVAVGLGWARQRERERRRAASPDGALVVLPAAFAGVLLLGLLWYTLA